MRTGLAIAVSLVGLLAGCGGESNSLYIDSDPVVGCGADRCGFQWVDADTSVGTWTWRG